MNIIYISRNIPVPSLKENDIILRIANSIEELSDINIDVFFPREVFPRMPFIRNKRVEAILNLPKKFSSIGREVIPLAYFRLPTLRYSYSLINSFKWLNSSLLESFSKYKVIHAHNIMPDGKIGMELKKILNIPLITTIRNGDLDKINKLDKSSNLYKSYMNVLHLSDKIIVHNYATEEFVKNLNLKYIAIPHGMEENLLLKEEANKENIILFVGNMIPRKNLKMVCNAFKTINNKNWQLLIIGDGKEFDEVQEQTKNIKNIQMLGRLPREKVLAYMQKSKVFVLPSDNETFGIVYLEAAASKCFIIGKKYTGIYGWLDNESEACFIENEEELREIFQKIFENQIDVQKIANQGYKKVNSCLLWEQQINKYIELYRSYS